MRIGLGKLLKGLSAAWIAAALATTQSPAQVLQTTNEDIKSEPVVTVKELRGTVEYVEDNTLLVRISTGDLREFTVAPARKFIIDGKELTVKQLKPGTTLTATIITKTTPVTQRTTTIGTGTVWWVTGNMVIVTLPNGENRMYNVDDSYRFAVDGKSASVHELRKGMKISAQKIVEEPRTEIASETVVTGSFHPAGESHR